MTTTRQVLTILAVSDVAQSAAFYDQVFGWPRQVDVPVYVEFEQPDGRRLGVYERQSFGLNTGVVPRAVEAGQLSGAELYFHTDEPQALMQRLEAAGAACLSPWAARGWGDMAAYYADPDGHVIVVASPQ